MRPHTRMQCLETSNTCQSCPAVKRSASASCQSVTQPRRSLTKTQASLAKKSHRTVTIGDLPSEMIVKILGYISFQEICHIRLVSRRFNEICSSMLNGSFQRLQDFMLARFQVVKALMPRRESARRSHHLAREWDIVETLHMRLTLLQMSFGKHIDRKNICFFAGEILDEVQRIITYILTTSKLDRAYQVTDELFDLTTMAMEYFKEYLEPNLPEITTYLGPDFPDFTTPFAASGKKQRRFSGRSGMASFDSPCSSRASVAGSTCSGTSSCPSIDFNTNADSGSSSNGAPASNMILRKRILKITKGMKRYDVQMDEVKRELKTSRNKMEAHSKQVLDYAQRLEEYDKKFEENSRKFQSVLTELNKCKTELQYWKSRSQQHLNTSCCDCQCETSAGSDTSQNAIESTSVSTTVSDDTLIADVEPNFDDQNVRGGGKSPLGLGRKRRSIATESRCLRKRSKITETTVGEVEGVGMASFVSL